MTTYYSSPYKTSTVRYEDGKEIHDHHYYDYADVYSPSYPHYYPGRYYGGRWFADRYYPRSIYDTDLYYPRYYDDRSYVLPREYYYSSSYAYDYVPRYHHLDYVPRYAYDSYYYPRYSSYWRY